MEIFNLQGGRIMRNNYDFQRTANISSLLEDKDYEERKNTLLRLLNEFKASNIRFGMACSFDLFLRGIVDEFHDFDFLVEEQDIPKIEQVMKELGAKLIATGGNGYCESKEYRHYQLERVDIDIIAGFRLVTFGTEYLYEYSGHEIQICEIFEEEKIIIPIISAEAMFLLYAMMEEWQPRRRYKRVLIGQYLEEQLVFHSIMEKALLENLPGWIKREVRRLLERRV